jgi:molybdate transport system substrate-binding protein
LARQIEAGANADVFFSADAEWVDYLQARALIEPSTRQNALSNRLVLVAPADSQADLRIAPHFPLAAAIGKGRLATGDPDSVPVGRYARSALRSLEVWSDVADRLVRADNVRVALAYVARGEARFAVVYETDALIEKMYPLALTRNAAPAANDYVAFVTGAAAAAIFKKYGFGTLQ